MIMNYEEIKKVICDFHKEYPTYELGLIKTDKEMPLRFVIQDTVKILPVIYVWNNWVDDEMFKDTLDEADKLLKGEHFYIIASKHILYDSTTIPNHLVNPAVVYKIR